VTIKNIIFDLGGVLLTWLPKQLANQFFPDPQAQDLIFTHLLNHPDWLELDRGSLTPQKASENAAKRSGLDPKTILALIEAVPASLNLVPETLELVKELQNAGVNLYVLSNMHQASADYIKAQFPIWDYFTGIVFSCDVNQVKPEKEIFETLLEKYDLVPQECLFIDDMENNTLAAQKLGFQALQFSSVEQSKTQILELKPELSGLNHWNNIWGNTKISPEYDGWLDFIKHEFTTETTLLELGVGSAVNLPAYGSLEAKNIYLSDFSSAAIAKLKKNYPKYQRFQQDISQPFPADLPKFNFIVADLCLHYFDNQTTTKIIDQLHSLLADNGQLIFRVNSTLDKTGGFGEGIEIEPHVFSLDNRIKHFFDDKELESLFKNWEIIQLTPSITEKYGWTKHCFIGQVKR
jgi:putative hydrolase of the HAD superfamily